MQDHFQIDQAHARAVCEEVGERLRQALSRDEIKLPADLESRLNLLRELDGEYPPSIVPSMDRETTQNTYRAVVAAKRKSR